MDVRGNKVTVVGLGKTALALVRLLRREGAEVVVSEARPREAVDTLCAELEALNVPVECGGHSDVAFDGRSDAPPGTKSLSCSWEACAWATRLTAL